MNHPRPGIAASCRRESGKDREQGSGIREQCGLVRGVIPPPILWTQNPCFLEVTDSVALQNIENKEVPCKILLDKELRAVSASSG